MKQPSLRLGEVAQSLCCSFLLGTCESVTTHLLLSALARHMSRLQAVIGLNSAGRRFPPAT